MFLNYITLLLSEQIDSYVLVSVLHHAIVKINIHNFSSSPPHKKHKDGRSKMDDVTYLKKRYSKHVSLARLKWYNAIKYTGTYLINMSIDLFLWLVQYPNQ